MDICTNMCQILPNNIRNIEGRRFLRTFPSCSNSTRPGFRFLRFPLVSLGNIAPKVGGIKVHSGSEVHHDEIIIDVNVEYAGNLRLDVEIGLSGMLTPSVSANISNVSLTGAIR